MPRGIRLNKNLRALARWFPGYMLIAPASVWGLFSLPWLRRQHFRKRRVSALSAQPYHRQGLDGFPRRFTTTEKSVGLNSSRTARANAAPPRFSGMTTAPHSPLQWSYLSRARPKFRATMRPLRPFACASATRRYQPRAKVLLPSGAPPISVVEVHSGAVRQLAVCLERLDRLSHVISGQDFGICCLAFRAFYRCLLWVKRGHFVLRRSRLSQF